MKVVVVSVSVVLLCVVPANSFNGEHTGMTF
jgi:hypothetical protein